MVIRTYIKGISNQEKELNMSERYKEYFLWNEQIPLALPDDADKQEHFLDSQDGIQRLTDVVKPSITYYPVSGKGPHPAVIVCPGGGYEILAWNHEGIDICSWLNSIGFTAFLLKYRCPDRRDAAHADACRAIRYVRQNAVDFNVLEDQIGILGFSAGAHLAAVTSAPAKAIPYEDIDETDKKEWRPNFTVLVYPAYLSDKDLNLAPEFKIDTNVPPTFMVQSEDDGIQVENSLAWFLALKRAGVKAEMHCYPEGGHGYGILRTGNPISNWPMIAGAWLRRQVGLK